MAQDDEAVSTPKQTGSYARAPIWRGAALDLAEKLDGLALRKSRVLAQLDISGAQDARIAASECRRLAERFRVWVDDPETTPLDRIKDYDAWLRVQNAAKALGVADWPIFR